MKVSEFILKVLGVCLFGQILTVLYFIYKEMVHPEEYNLSNTLLFLAFTIVGTYLLGVTVYESSKKNEK